MEKPTYTTSKRALWLNSILAWAVIIILAIGAVMGSAQAVAFGSIAVPSMVGLIVALLGIHRVTGALDLRAMLRAPSSEDPSNRPRDQPEASP